MKFLKVLTGLMILGCCWACGYHLAGTAGTLPPQIHTVCIPDFANRTVQFNVERFVSDSIREEFIRRTRLTLVSDRSTADALIEGEVVYFQATPVTYSSSGEGNLHEIEIRINLKFINNLDNSIVFQQDNMSYTDTYRIDSGDVSGFLDAALERMGKKFASEIINTIFTGIR